MAGKTLKTPAKGATKPVAKTGAAKPKLLAGGNPQIPKAYGDAPVQAYIAAMPGWKHDIGRRLDALIVRTVPGVRKAVKWNSPFYGAGDEDQGWFLSLHCFARYVKGGVLPRRVAETSPARRVQAEARALSRHPQDDRLDEAQFSAWVKQVSVLPGERM